MAYSYCTGLDWLLRFTQDTITLGLRLGLGLGLGLGRQKKN
jgi:hypothetical protein